MSAPASVAVVRAAAQPDRVGATPDLGDEPIVDLVLDDRPAAGRADLAASGRTPRSGRCRRRVSKSASAKTMFGLLPPSSIAIFFMLTAAPRTSARPASMPPVSEMRSTSGLSASAWPTRVARTEDEVARRRRGTPASSSSRVRWIAVSGVTGRGLHDRGAAGRERRRDLPAQLQERVVPRPDEPAHADRLVDDPADDVRVAGVHEPPGLLVGEVGVVAEDARDVGDVPAALAHGLAGVAGLRGGQPSWSRSSRSATRSSSAARSLVGVVRPVGRVEGAPGGRDGGLDLLVGGDVDLGDERSRRTG